MNDSLNAEIALGTVSNVSEAVQWVGYTYLFVRLKKNPRLHGSLAFLPRKRTTHHRGKAKSFPKGTLCATHD